MAAPRVFVSSTYYDLRHVRDDIEIFIKGLGYVPVMHDKGNVTYTQGETSLEQSCYNELASCDIVICIIGGNYGTQSSGSNYSITMGELQEAIKRRKIIYVYVLKDVLSENFTYINNQENNFKPYHVNDVRIHQFICELKQRLKSTPMQPFESVSDITTNLSQQLAGMFQYLLNKESTITETKTFEDLQSVAIQIKDLTIDQNSHIVSRHGDQIDLTPIEFEILYVLASHPGQAYSKERLYETIWKEPYLANENVLNTHINRLRTKLKQSPEDTTVYIKTLWGIGYKMEDQ